MADPIPSGTKRTIFLALLALSLSGCIGSAVRDAKCQSWGARPGSDAYVNCRAQLEAARRRGHVCNSFGATTVCS